MEKIKQFFKFGAEKGLYFPYAFDAERKVPSATLFFAYISFYIAAISVILLHFNEKLLTATIMTFIFTGMMIVFYMIRKLNKAKIDLDDKSIELDGTEEK